MDIKNIIKNYLEDNGYDGLFFPGECACTINDLMPCENFCNECEAGVFRDCKQCGNKDNENKTCDRGFDYCIGPK
jgi:hypothetical protein